MKIRLRKPAARAAPAEEQPAPVDLTGLLPAGLRHGDLTPNRILSPQENLEAFLGRKPPPRRRNSSNPANSPTPSPSRPPLAMGTRIPDRNRQCPPPFLIACTSE